MPSNASTVIPATLQKEIPPGRLKKKDTNVRPFNFNVGRT